jgi:DNA-binding NarL/FixJ family response regulator
VADARPAEAVGIVKGPARQARRRQREVLRAYIGAGSIDDAAAELGISPATARQHLHGLYHRTGCANTAQAAYLLGRAEVRVLVHGRFRDPVSWTSILPLGGLAPGADG